MNVCNQNSAAIAANRFVLLYAFDLTLDVTFDNLSLYIYHLPIFTIFKKVFSYSVEFVVFLHNLYVLYFEFTFRL